MLNQKIIAIAAGFALATFAAVGAFASQDGVSSLQETETETATVEATETPIDGTETPTATDTPTDTTETPTPTDTPAAGTETPAPTDTPTDATETPAPTDTPSDATETPAPTETPESDVHGIPDSNPVFEDDDGDGVCEKHETAVKTTPSGNQVRVPCHAAGGHGNGGNGNGGNGNGHGHGHGGGN